MEEAILNGVAFDGAGDGAVREARRLGRGGQGLPAHLEIKVNAGLQTQNEGELDVGFDGLALLVFLRGRGLHDEDVVLVFCAVGQGHGHGPAGVDWSFNFVSAHEEGSGDGGILRVETCEVEAVGQVAVIQLREQDTLAHGLARCADDGRRLGAIFVPRQGCAEVERREGQIFVGLAGLSGIFAVVALVGIGVRADAGLRIIRLARLILRNGLLLRILPGFVVRLIGVGLLDVALEVAVCITVCTGAGGFRAVAASHTAGGLARLQNGDLLWFGLQNGIFRLG